jgi:hypothetical protein
MRIAKALILVGTLLSTAAAAAPKVAYTGDFETGQIQPADSTHDGFYIKTLPNPQLGSEILVSGKGGFGPSSASDTRVVSSEPVGGEVVRPRKGNFFARSALYYDKDYRNVNNGVLDKPRSFLNITNPKYNFSFDTEVYIGLSIYTPLNYENETGSTGDLGYLMLLSVNADDTTRSIFTLRHIVAAGQTQAHWDLRLYTDATSVQESTATLNDINLGSVTPDIGKWTDFVIRLRANPFAVATNPAVAGIPNSMNKLYEGNKGILQIWKSEGSVDADGNRKMVLKVDKVNTPVGLVPGTTDAIQISPRVYKGGWKKHPTSVTGPVWFGFDEVRYGQAVRDGTGFDDVNPAGVAASSAPEPPRSLSVN